MRDSTGDCWWVYRAIMIMVQRPEGDPAVIDVNDAERLVALHTLAHSSQSNYSDILAAFNYAFSSAESC